MTWARLGKMFLLRILAATIFIMAVYNIWGVSYWHWVTSTPFEGFNEFLGVLKISVGIILFVILALFFRATYRSKGPLGIATTVVILATFVWMLSTADWFDLTNPDIGTVTGQVVLTIVLAIGSMWSHVWKKSTGQYDMDRIDTDSEDN